MAKSNGNKLINGLMAALERDSRVGIHDFPVHACIREGGLTLEGTMGSIEAKKVAVGIARSLVADMPVVDRLRVAPADPREDGALRDELVNLFQREPVFTEYSLRVMRNGVPELVRDTNGAGVGMIDIEVKDGAVELRGNVSSPSHRRITEVLAWWTAGCELVDNRLEVVPPVEEEDDGELTDVIRMALEKDPLVHAGQLLVGAKEGMVTLDGYVASKEEKRLAVLDTWAVPGVREVVDRIEARM